MMNRWLLPCLILLSVFAGSCGSEAEKKTTETVSAPAQTESSVPATKKALNLETAETIVAGYYSDLNRAAGYNRYKGLGLNILDIKAEQDSSVFLIYSENTGRIRIHNSEDTSSAAFAEKLTLRASFLNNNWEAEPIP